MSHKRKDLTSSSTKVLVVYYSRSGNTRELAKQIQRGTGGDIVEIHTVDPYPDDYNAVVKQAKQELEADYRPAIKLIIENISSYDVIFIGSPNWWHTIAPPVKTFLSEYDLSGKTIALFITHGGGGIGRCVADISALCPSSTILDSFSIYGDRSKVAQNEVSEWLRKVEVEKKY